MELYRRLRPGEVPTDNGVEILVNNIFFDARRYDVTHVGRYKYNKKLSLAERIGKLTLARDVVSPDGEILAEKGAVLNREQAWEIQNAGVNVVYVETPDGGEFKVIGNNTVDLAAYIDCRSEEHTSELQSLY